LQEFIARRRQKGLLDLMGKLEWDVSYVRALESGEPIQTTGLVLQELLQGFRVRKLASGSWIGFLRYRSWFRIGRITSGPRS
jgi:hypothetical protein